MQRLLIIFYSKIYDIVKGNLDILDETYKSNIGKFIAYRNGSVRVKFEDRTTICFTYPPPCEISIINKIG